MKHCRTHYKRLCWRCFWFTAGFPIEHLMWERLPLLSNLTHLMGV